MAIDSLSTSGASTAAAGATQKSSKASDAKDTQDRFIKLLVTQLQNQDPLSPMDNSQVTSQMAQLNTVSGIQSMNDTMKSLAGSFNASQSLQATSMLGRTVMVEGTSMALKNGIASAALDMKQPADSVSVDVKNAAGQVVSSISLGNLKAGLHDIQWDGKANDGTQLPEGDYSFAVTAKAAGQNAAFTSLSVAKVLGVSQSSDGVRLLTDVSGEQKLSNVQRIF